MAADLQSNPRPATGVGDLRGDDNTMAAHNGYSASGQTEEGVVRGHTTRHGYCKSLLGTPQCRPWLSAWLTMAMWRPPISQLDPAGPLREGSRPSTAPPAAVKPL